MTGPARLDGPEPEVPVEHGTPEGAKAEATGAPEPSLVTGSESEPTAAAPRQLVIMSAQLTQLREMLEGKIKDDERERQWVTQLTSELTQYRDDFVYKNVISKALADLVRLYDTIDQTLDPLVVERISKEDLVTRLRNLRQQLLKAFDRQGVEQLKSEAQTPFDESQQEAIDVRPVNQSADHEMVLESVRCGFRYGSRLLRPESVIVGRYESKDE